jgi:hypothetical protein
MCSRLEWFLCFNVLVGVFIAPNNQKSRLRKATFFALSSGASDALQCWSGAPPNHVRLVLQVTVEACQVTVACYQTVRCATGAPAQKCRFTCSLHTRSSGTPTQQPNSFLFVQNFFNFLTVLEDIPMS